MNKETIAQRIAHSVATARHLAELRRYPTEISADTLSALADAEAALNREIELFFGLHGGRPVERPTDSAVRSSPA